MKKKKKKKKTREECAHGLFDTLSPAAEGAEEEDGDGAGEENTGSDLDGRRVVGGGENGRSGREWKFNRALSVGLKVNVCCCIGELCEPWRNG